MAQYWAQSGSPALTEWEDSTSIPICLLLYNINNDAIDTSKFYPWYPCFSGRPWIHKSSLSVQVKVESLEFIQIFLMDCLWIKISEQLRIEPLCYTGDTHRVRWAYKDRRVGHEDFSVLHSLQVLEFWSSCYLFEAIIQCSDRPKKSTASPAIVVAIIEQCPRTPLVDCWWFWTWHDTPLLQSICQWLYIKPHP